MITILALYMKRRKVVDLPDRPPASYIDPSKEIDIRMLLKDPLTGKIKEYRDGRCYKTNLKEI